MRYMTTVRACLWGGLVTIAAPRLALAETTEEHRALMIAGQVMRNEGKLLRSREVLASCAGEPCSDASDGECAQIRAYCKKRLEAVELEVPTVRAVVTDDLGNALPRANVSIGGVLVPSGRDLELDPGHHVLHADYFGRTTVVEFDLETDIKKRVVRATIDLRSTVQERPLPWYFWAFATTSAVGVASTVGFGLATNAQHRSLEACQPTCDPSRKGLLSFTTITTDVSLVFAAVGVLGSVVSYLTRPVVTRTVRLDARGSVK